jgi:hypothetical protein
LGDMVTVEREVKDRDGDVWRMGLEAVGAR